MTVNRTDNDITGWPKTKEKKDKRDNGRLLLYRIAVSRTTRGISRTPFKCPENAHTQKRRQSTRSIVSFFFCQSSSSSFGLFPGVRNANRLEERIHLCVCVRFCYELGVGE
jgi:hypothetical protein